MKINSLSYYDKSRLVALFGAIVPQIAYFKVCNDYFVNSERFSKFLSDLDSLYHSTLDLIYESE